MGRPSKLADDRRADHGIGSSLAHIGSRLLDSHPDRFPTVFDVVLKRLTVRGSMVGASHDLDEAVALLPRAKVRADIEITTTTQAAPSG